MDVFWIDQQQGGIFDGLPERQPRQHAVIGMRIIQNQRILSDYGIRLKLADETHKSLAQLTRRQAVQLEIWII